MIVRRDFERVSISGPFVFKILRNGKTTRQPGICRSHCQFQGPLAAPTYSLNARLIVSSTLLAGLGAARRPTDYRNAIVCANWDKS